MILLVRSRNEALGDVGEHENPRENSVESVADVLSGSFPNLISIATILVLKGF